MRLPDLADGIPPSPPPEVQAAVEQASRSLDELAQRRVSLGFTISGDARVSLQVRGAGGSVVRDISPAHALELLETDPGSLGGFEG